MHTHRTTEKKLDGWILEGACIFTTLSCFICILDLHTSIYIQLLSLLLSLFVYES